MHYLFRKLLIRRLRFLRFSEFFNKPPDLSCRCSIKLFTEMNKVGTLLVVNANNQLTILFFILFLIQRESSSRTAVSVNASPLNADRYQIMRYMTIHHIAPVYTFSTFTTVVWHPCLTDIAKNEKTRRKKTAYDKQRPFLVCVCSTLTFVKP